MPDPSLRSLGSSLQKEESFMNRHCKILSILMALACCTTVAGRAAEPDAAALVAEFTGQGAAQTRDQGQLDAAYAKVLDSLLPNMSSADLTVRGDAQNTWERVSLHAGWPGQEPQRLAAARAMVAKLGADTPQEARVWLLKQLDHIGRGEAVSALVTLLDDKDTLVKETARRALSNDVSPEAGPALRAALGRADTPEWRVAIINALGYRRDTAAVADIARLAADKDETVAAAAISALGRIADPQSVRTLDALKAGASPTLRTLVVDSQLLMAERLRADGKAPAAAAIYQQLYAPAEAKRVRIAGLRGLVAIQGARALPAVSDVLRGNDARMAVMAVRFAGEVPGAAMTQGLAGLVSKVPEAAQVALLDELGSRGDVTARTAVLAAAKDNSVAVRTAALEALGKLGSGADVALLATTAATSTDPERSAARDSLTHLAGRDVNDAIVKAMAGADSKLRMELVRALAARRVTTATPALLQAAQDQDAALRLEAIKALGTLGDEKSVAPLVGLMVQSPSDEQRQAAQQALIDVSDRLQNRAPASDVILAALPGAATPARVALLGTLKSYPSPKALEAVRAATKDVDAKVQDAAVRALSDWPDAAAVPDLREIATGGDETHQVLALRGYARLVAASDRPAAEKLKMLQEGLALAKRPEEKRLFLAGLGDVTTVESLNLVQPYLDDKTVSQEAAAATVNIMKAIVGQVPDGKAVLRKVVAVARNRQVLRDANSLMGRAKG